MMASARALSFSWLIQPATLEQFQRDCYERAHFVLARGDPDFYRGLFGYGDVDRCLHVARESSREVVTLVPPPGSRRGRERYRGDQLTPALLQRAFAGGDTVSLIGLEKLWPPLAELAAALAAELSAPVGINSYLTPPRSQGFSIHFDAHDVLILQVEGEKDWNLYRPTCELPLEPHRLRYVKPWFRTLLYEGEVELRESLRLKQGDLLYLPRGLPHRAATAEGASLHLSVGFHPVSWLDVLGAALELVGKQDAELRRSLPLGFARSPETTRGLEEVFGVLMERLSREASFKAALDLLANKTLSAQAFPPDGHFEQLARADGLEAGTTVQRRPGLSRLNVVHRSEGAALVFAGTELQAPPTLAPALEYVRDHERFQVGDLPGDAAETEKAQLVSRLIVEGVLRRCRP